MASLEFGIQPGWNYNSKSQHDYNYKGYPLKTPAAALSMQKLLCRLRFRRTIKKIVKL